MLQAEYEREALQNQSKNYPDNIEDNFSSHQYNIKLMCEENNREEQIVQKSESPYLSDKYNSNASDSQIFLSNNDQHRECLGDMGSSDNDTFNRKRKREDSPADHCFKEFEEDEIYEHVYKDLNSSGFLNVDFKTEKNLSGEPSNEKYPVSDRRANTSIKKPRRAPGTSSKPKTKPKKAPLMAKSISLMKKLLKRKH
ncbi:hypothetical protein GWI33_004069 [Rhynchophorus ferrugineus]|uniref:Uncharacterized protein n=1 Tax=Rhynchophorus ferrugineus TaxID=354439 RepID=A0A834HI63_RHYFE|nr:hypothetical protein GWI33_004069 [Rhynchophorus ferrugineus]